MSSSFLLLQVLQAHACCGLTSYSLQYRMPKLACRQLQSRTGFANLTDPLFLGLLSLKSGSRKSNWKYWRYCGFFKTGYPCAFQRSYRATILFFCQVQNWQLENPCGSNGIVCLLGDFRNQLLSQSTRWDAGVGRVGGDTNSAIKNDKQISYSR